MPGDEEEPSSDAGRPDSPRDPNDPDRENRDAGAPPGSTTERLIQPADVGDGWGNLPRHVRDSFRSEDLGDLPPRYRAWIDAYYRRLSERSRR